MFDVWIQKTNVFDTRLLQPSYCWQTFHQWILTDCQGFEFRWLRIWKIYYYGMTEWKYIRVDFSTITVTSLRYLNMFGFIFTFHKALTHKYLFPKRRRTNRFRKTREKYMNADSDLKSVRYKNVINFCATDYWWRSSYRNSVLMFL